MDARLLLFILAFGAIALVYFVTEIVPRLALYLLDNGVYAFAVCYCFVIEAILLLISIAMSIFGMAIVALFIAHLAFCIYKYTMAQLPSLPTIVPWMARFWNARVFVKETFLQTRDVYQSLHDSTYMLLDTFTSQPIWQQPDLQHSSSTSRNSQISSHADREPCDLRNQYNYGSQTTPQRRTRSSFVPPGPEAIHRSSSKLKNLRMPKRKASNTHRRPSAPATSSGTFTVPDDDSFNEDDDFYYLDEYDEPIYNRHFQPVEPRSKGRSVDWWDVNRSWQGRSMGLS